MQAAALISIMLGVAFVRGDGASTGEAMKLLVVLIERRGDVFFFDNCDDYDLSTSRVTPNVNVFIV